MTTLLDDLDRYLSWLREPLAEALLAAEKLREQSAGQEALWWAELIRERVRALETSRESTVRCVALCRQIEAKEAVKP